MERWLPTTKQCKGSQPQRHTHNQLLSLYKRARLFSRNGPEIDHPTAKSQPWPMSYATREVSVESQCHHVARGTRTRLQYRPQGSRHFPIQMRAHHDAETADLLAVRWHGIGGKYPASLAHLHDLKLHGLGQPIPQVNGVLQSVPHHPRISIAAKSEEHIGSLAAREDVLPEAEFS